MTKVYRTCPNMVCIAVFFAFLFSFFCVFMHHGSAVEMSGQTEDPSLVISGHLFSAYEHSGTEKPGVSLCTLNRALLPEFRNCSSLRFPAHEIIRRWKKNMERNIFISGFTAVFFCVFFRLFSGVCSRTCLFLQSQFYVFLRILLRKDGKSRFFLFS